MKCNLEIFNLDDLCRLCLNQLGSVNMFKPIDITKDIFNATGVKILISDALPQSICKKCFCLIKDAIELRNVSQRNDARLRRLMGDPGYSNEVTTNHNSKAQEGQESTPACKPCSSMCNAISNSSELQSSTKRQYNKSSNTQESSNNNSSVPYDFSDVANKPKKKYNTKKNRSLLKQDNKCDVANINTEDPEHIEIELNKVQNNIKIEVIEETEHVPIDSSFTNESLNSDVTDDCLLIPIKRRRLSSNEDTEFTYECETCLKVFPSRKRLVVHLRNHNKTFMCSIVGCEKSFACNHDLQKHFRSHTGEKPYQCRICLKCFTQNGTLKYHKTRVQPCCDYYKAIESDEMILSDLPSLDNTASAAEIEKWLPRMPTLEAMLQQPIEVSTLSIGAPSLPIETQSSFSIPTSEDQIIEKAEPILTSQMIEMFGAPEQLPTDSDIVTPSDTIDT